jgi:putative glutamine amidotransferase
MMLPLTAEKDELDYFLETCDGFLLTGGQDVSPALYGEEAVPQCGEICPARDVMDEYILREAVERDKPVLGICRGHQLMNAVYGGTLYQDLPTQNPSEVMHCMTAPYDRGAHMVSVCEQSPLMDLLGKSECSVNSYHHQAIKTLAPVLSPMAVSPDGLIEAIYMPGKRFVWGVQWHPEFSYRNSPESVAIIQAFLRAVGENGASGF